MSDRYIQIEVDEFGHSGHECFDEDTRLEIIAADVGLPGTVVRINPDHPPCFRRKRLRNGELVEERVVGTFDTLLERTATATRNAMMGPPPTEVRRIFIDACGPRQTNARGDGQ